MNSPMQNEGRKQAIAIGLMAIAVVAAVTIGGVATRAPGTQVEAAWLQEIETGADHIDAKNLARELLAGPSDLVLIDVRPAEEYARYHLPFAQNLSVPEVCGTAGAALFAQNPRLVVLYSNGPAHPAQAWLELQRQGHQNVKVLAGGLDDFKSLVLTPPSLRDGASEASSKAELPTSALERAFFLGDSSPNRLATWATDPAQLTAPTVVSPKWLHERLGKVAILDVRPSAVDFAALHVPGAVRLELGKMRIKQGDRDLFFLPPAEVARQFGELGVGDDTPVVIYADDKMQDATMAAVALLGTGHKSLALLEGGILRWATEKRPLTSVVTTPKPASLTVHPPIDDFAIVIDDLAKVVQNGSAQVLDVRPPEFFRGDKSTEARPGHIPGAKNRPYQKDLTRTEDGQWFRDRKDLEQEYAALGLQKTEPIVVHCRTGHTASESYFVLRYLLGYDKVRWYNGSWTEWAARSDLPAKLGDQ
jgi:3-mercaptopyruvate sulfurtransferase SseA